MALSKYPIELRQVTFNLAALIAQGAALSSATAYASRKVTLSTELAAAANLDDATLSLVANPGVGALLTVNPGGVTEEQFKVGAVSGEGPYSCDIIPSVEFGHSSGEAVDYEPGASGRVLVDPNASIVETTAVIEVQLGADAQTYRLSVLAVCDNAERLEDEVDLLVIEAAPTETVVKQPAEIRDIATNFAALIPVGQTLDSAIAFVSRQTSLSTTVADNATAGASSLSLAANPGIGALLIVNIGGPTQEKLHVSGVSGGPPYVTTVAPAMEFAHSSGETVSYEPGVSSRLLTSTTATIMANNAIVRARRGAAGQTYRLRVVGTLSNGEIVQHSATISTPEL